MIRITMNRECLVRQLREHARFQIDLVKVGDLGGGVGRGGAFCSTDCTFTM